MYKNITSSPDKFWRQILGDGFVGCGLRPIDSEVI